MMTLIACALGLLAMFAGARLLIQSRQEALGRLVKGIAWFILAAGFFVAVSSLCLTALSCCREGAHMGACGAHPAAFARCMHPGLMGGEGQRPGPHMGSRHAVQQGCHCNCPGCGGAGMHQGCMAKSGKPGLHMGGRCCSDSADGD